MTTISVLYVDDDEDEFIILDDVFKQINDLIDDDILELTDDRFELICEKDFSEGIKKYISGKFDVCLLDYRLGEKNANEFLRSVFLYLDQAPIIVLTHHDEWPLDVCLMEHGIRSFIAKSDITPISLERIIRHVLDEFKHSGMVTNISQHWEVKASKNVLCVEDDLDDYEILRHNLNDIKSTVYHPTHVTNLKAATEEYLGNHHYDICLLDYKLGADSGLDMLQELGTNISRIPVVMLTNFDDPVLDHISMKLGVSGFLPKSQATKDQLERMLRYVIHYSDRVVY